MLRSLILLTPFGLAACVGPVADLNAPVATRALSFAELDALNTSLIDAITAAGATDYAGVPTAGDATYNGTMIFTLLDGSEDGVIGSATADVNFQSGAISGGGSEFYDLDGNPTDGEISFVGLTIYDVGGIFYLVQGAASGAITFTAGEMAVDASVAANFSGGSADYLSGVMSGTATPDGGSAVTVQGGFYAQAAP